MSRARALVGIAATRLWYRRRQVALAVVAVAVAVLLVVVLTGLGYGLFSTGDRAIGWLGRDLWATGGALQFAPGSVGGIENPIPDAHRTAAAIESREDVAGAQPLAFQSVYVSTNTSEFSPVVGVGIGNATAGAKGSGAAGLPANPEGFSRGDAHYADGSYDGPMSREVIIDERTARQFNVSVGDTLYIGGTLEAAHDNGFTVVGIARTFSTYLGVATVTLPLSELQAVTDTTGDDRAAIIGITTTADAEPRAVATAIEREHESLAVRTNQEQVQHIVGGQTGATVSAVALVALAVVGGVVLVTNMLALWVYHQRAEFAALKATGMSSRSLVGLLLLQGATIGLLGGVVGIAASVPAIHLVNSLAEQLSGFADLVAAPPWIFAVGLTIAVGMGTVGAVVAGYRVVRVSPLAHLGQ